MLKSIWHLILFKIQCNKFNIKLNDIKFELHVDPQIC